ncbi:hypothetical protein AXG93_2415s1180 [Marchantia polymorpha subsp. ruderalis]|uniref:Fibronectin type III-like domain-containing protein n=1 Tax=Marchantia polymorpha subsp. ruderalis TaxID=1480154 RepID=A0A176VUR7_MARPO|nr:hypothetical protein AXG93_2415s1180 [Marchantia polymorpha subsp. ruderalis]
MAAWRYLAVFFVFHHIIQIFQTFVVHGTALHGCGSDLDASILAMPFCNISIPIADRTLDLVSRLTLQEKIAQLVNTAPEVTRLGIPRHEWWNEALHGVAYSPGVTFTGPASGATSFPQPILTASSFNMTLWTLVGQARGFLIRVPQAISTEGRAMYNLGQSHLTFWAPNINIFRDPRWGRGQETPGEDPLLTSIYASTFVRAMQEIRYSDEGSRYKAPFGVQMVPSELDTTEERSPAVGRMLKTSVCCKHFTAYDVENWDGIDRYHFNAEVSDQDLEDTYNRPFQSCVQEGQASSMMCSYNRVNGVPTCANYNLLTETARNTWGLNGYITSDCDAVELIYSAVNYAPSAEDAVAEVLMAGLDLNCGSTAANFGQSAVDQGKVNESTIDRALFDLFSVRMRLGEFDGDPENQIYGSLGLDDICSQYHKELAIEAAGQGIVLLKNDNNVLPFLRGHIQKLALTGPNANATSSMLGNYAGVPCEYITPLQGLQTYVDLLLYEPGCWDISCQDGGLIGAAAAIASSADAVVIVAGIDQTQEQETLDRTSLLLPGQQQSLIETVANSSKGPVILVIMSGGAVDISFAKFNPQIHGILWVGYPGQGGGQALADILFGHRNPGGRLPVTWYPESFTQVSMTDMNMKPNTSSGYPGRSYRFYTGETVYSFGDGLSYTNFLSTITSAPSRFLIPSLEQQRCYHNFNSTSKCPKGFQNELTCDTASFEVRVSVSNQGVRRGSETLMLYSVPPKSGIGGEPLKQLIAFQRVSLDAYSSMDVGFEVLPCKHLSSVKYDGTKELVEGTHTLVLGSKDEVSHAVSFVTNFF